MSDTDWKAFQLVTILSYEQLQLDPLTKFERKIDEPLMEL